MRILITGANGLLGSNLALMYSKNNDIYATGKTKPSFNFCSNYKLDILSKKNLQFIKEKKPDMVINCAALTNVNYCEENESLAEEINSKGVEALAKICKEIECYFVHISTDAVFDGKKGNYSEQDKPNPLSVYGKTKLNADNIVKNVGGRYLIVRTNIYGWNYQKKFSLAEWMLDRLETHQKLPGFEDIYFSPILVNNLGEAIIELYKKNYIGILNVAGSEKCSKLDFAKKIAKIFNLDEKVIEPIKSDELNFKAKRGKDMSFNINKAKGLLQTKLLNVEEGLKRFKETRGKWSK